MSSELGKRRAQIIEFLKELSTTEKLIALTYLANDAGISAHIPNLARIVLDIRRSHYRVELLKLATENSNLDLEFLARRKRCRLEPVNGPGDRWCIVPASGSDTRLGLGDSRKQRISLTRKQVLDFLHSLPDEQSNA